LKEAEDLNDQFNSILLKEKMKVAVILFTDSLKYHLVHKVVDFSQNKEY